jgi:hypothetical protein
VNECTAGRYAQWLDSLALVDGDIVWIAEVDDTCEPAWLESLMFQFEDPVTAFVTRLQDGVDNEAIQHSSSYNSISITIGYINGFTACQRDGAGGIRENLCVHNTLPRVSTVLVRRFDIDNNLREAILSLHYFGDCLLYLNALEHGRVAFVPLPSNPDETQRGRSGQVSTELLTLLS